MTAEKYAETLENLDINPIRAAIEFHDLIDENIWGRAAVLAELLAWQRTKAARQTFNGASRLADLLIENAGSRAKLWFEPETGDEITCAEIATTSHGMFSLTRFDNNSQSYYEVAIVHKSLAAAEAKLEVGGEDGMDSSDEWKIDLIAHIDNISEQIFDSNQHAELEWGYELLMTIALDQAQSAGNRGV